MKLDNAIKTALEYEAGVHKIYRQAMDKTIDPAAKRVFRVLCKEEMEHLKYLQERLEEWQKTGKVVAKKLGTSIPARTASSIRGTAIKAVARSRFTVRMISAGFADGSNTTVAPSSGGTNKAMNCPNTWLSGTSVTNRKG